MQSEATQIVGHATRAVVLGILTASCGMPKQEPLVVPNIARQKLSRNEIVLCFNVRQSRTADMAAIAKAAGFDVMYARRIIAEHTGGSAHRFALQVKIMRRRTAARQAPVTVLRSFFTFILSAGASAPKRRCERLSNFYLRF